MSFWEQVRNMFTPSHAPPIQQDPEVGESRLFPNPHQRRMEFGRDNDQLSLLPQPTAPKDPRLEPLQGQPNPESGFHILDHTSNPDDTVGIFPASQNQPIGPMGNPLRS